MAAIMGCIMDRTGMYEARSNQKECTETNGKHSGNKHRFLYLKWSY